MKRLVEFDLLKCFAIFLVLWGHAIQYLLSSEYSDEPIYRHIYSFHMPLFMMISGFFFAKTTKGNFVTTIKRKFLQLLLPAILWICIFSTLKTIKTGFPSLIGIMGSLEHSLWFLKSVFVCCIIGFFVCHKLKHKILMGGVICVSLQLILDQQTQVAYMFPCFLLGMTLQWNYNGILKILSIPQYALFIISVLFIFLLLGNIYLDSEMYKQLVKSFELPLWSSPYNICLRIYRFFMGFSGSLFFITLFIALFKGYHVGKVGAFLSKLGTETLGIYILQSYILEYLLARHVNFDNESFILFNFVIAPLISGAVLICSYEITQIIKMNKTLSFLLLGVQLPISRK